MKIITALELIKKQEKEKREAEKGERKAKLLYKNSGIKNPYGTGNKKPINPKDLVNVRSVFSQDDVIALKVKTREIYIQEAIAKAIYFFLAHTSESEKLALIDSEVSQKIRGIKYIHVNSVLPYKDIITLKEKTGEKTTKEMISKAVYFYLKYGQEPEAEK